MLFLLSGAFLVGEAVDLATHRDVTPPALAAREIRDLGLAMVVAFGALALNPNGIALWAYPAQAIGNTVIDQYIFEWFPVTSSAELLVVYVAFVLLVVAPTLALLRRGLRMSDALTVIGLAVMPSCAALLLDRSLVAAVAAAAPRRPRPIPVRPVGRAQAKPVGAARGVAPSPRTSRWQRSW
jgi:hypothetical protein